MPDIVHSHDKDPVGPRRIVTYEIVAAEGEIHVITDSGPYAGDASAKAMLLTHEKAGPGETLKWDEVRIFHSFERRTGVVFPIRTRETFRVQASVYEPVGGREVSASSRRAAIDAFVGAWPMHAGPAEKLVAQDRVVVTRINWNGVAMELVSYALIAIVVSAIWRGIAAGRRKRRTNATASSPARA